MQDELMHKTPFRQRRRVLEEVGVRFDNAMQSRLLVKLRPQLSMRRGNRKQVFDLSFPRVTPDRVNRGEQPHENARSLQDFQPMPTEPFRSFHAAIIPQSSPPT